LIAEKLKISEDQIAESQAALDRLRIKVEKVRTCKNIVTEIVRVDYSYG